MSLFNAMYSGVSGLTAESDALGIVGDNVSNSNTIGFKQSRAIFEDVLGSTAGSEHAEGAGVRMQRTQQIFGEGSLITTGQSTDLALSGDGFFVVHGTIDGVTNNYYTRAGQTSLQSDGTLVNPGGLAIQGYAAKPNGTFNTTVSDIKIQTTALSPKTTSKMNFTANLDATATVTAFNAASPSTTSNFTSSMKVYDSLGTAHSVDVYFAKTAANQWGYHAMVDGGDIGGVAGTPVEIGTGALTFTGAGALQSVATTLPINASFNNATPNQAIALNFGTSIAAGGTGLGGTSQFSTPSNVTQQGQDGYASGSLNGVKIDGAGIVRGVYTNGEQVAMGQLVVAKFLNNDGLGRAGHNLWTQTRNSGDAAIGQPSSGGRASIVTGALEQSNVDIATQFVELIAHQRAFQANSKTITTADQMLQELMGIKQ